MPTPFTARSPRVIFADLAWTDTCGLPSCLEKRIVPRTSPSAFSNASAASGPMSGRSSAMSPSGRKASSSTRSPRMLFGPSDSDSPSISRRPSVVLSTALPLSCWPATVPASVRSAAGLAMSALPLADSFSSVISRLATVMRSLSTVSDRSGAAVGPLACTSNRMAPAASLDSSERSASAPCKVAASMPSVRLALPPASSAPEASFSPSTARLPFASRLIAADSFVRSASTPRAAAGSAADSASTPRLSAMEPSASETRPSAVPSSASPCSFALAMVSTSSPRPPLKSAVMRPANSGATVGFSMTMLSALALPASGPLRLSTSNPLECSESRTPFALTSFVASEARAPPTSSFSAFFGPTALADRDCRARSIGLSGVPSDSGRLSPLDFTSSVRSLAPLGSNVPCAVPDTPSPESVACRRSTAPPGT